ncbi:hypothetical protein C8Q79DRAFT_52469 [Trametes meyenii]|nr:hypothetical protein C8Q79DRAFT_52469 [Trametes meyenii]
MACLQLPGPGLPAPLAQIPVHHLPFRLEWSHRPQPSLTPSPNHSPAGGSSSSSDPRSRPPSNAPTLAPSPVSPPPGPRRGAARSLLYRAPEPLARPPSPWPSLRRCGRRVEPPHRPHAAPLRSAFRVDVALASQGTTATADGDRADIQHGFTQAAPRAAEKSRSPTSCPSRGAREQSVISRYRRECQARTVCRDSRRGGRSLVLFYSTTNNTHAAQDCGYFVLLTHRLQLTSPRP